MDEFFELFCEYVIEDDNGEVTYYKAGGFWYNAAHDEMVIH